jgi:chromosome partitioning protein
MAFVIAVAQRKGGAGKSTLAANLATTLAQSGARVALLDTDPQKSLVQWRAQRDGAIAQAAALAFEDPSGWRVPAALDRLRKGHDFVVVDTPPHDDTDARLAIRGADLALVPLQPSHADLWSSEATLNMAAAEKRPVRMVLNRVPPTGRLRDEIMAELARRKLPVMDAMLGNRSAFPAAFAKGLGVTEAAPRSAAAEEMRVLAESIARLAKRKG